MTSERAVDGWDEVRREIEALPGMTLTDLECCSFAYGSHFNADGTVGGDLHPAHQPVVKSEDRAISRNRVLAIVDRLAAARGEPGLDVERLAALAEALRDEHDRLHALGKHTNRMCLRTHALLFDPGPE